MSDTPGVALTTGMRRVGRGSPFDRETTRQIIARLAAFDAARNQAAVECRSVVVARGSL